MKWILLTLICLPLYVFSQNQKQPNVIIILTDDQGYGDLGFNGNPHIKTPNLDRFASESIRFNRFYVSPVCAPTRSSLLTGRYSLRTGVRDTYNGGAIMAGSEVTIAEILRAEGYSTGIFGKWHLGDNYPFRPSDQGFDQSVIHHGGGMGQPGDVANYHRQDSSYFDPILHHNNQLQSYKGYCSDIFTSEAISFIKSKKNQPFFCYLSFNAPHTPLQVPDQYYQMYKDIDPSSGWTDLRAQMSEQDKEDARKVYAMVSNIDDNVQRLLNTLNQLSLEEETIVIFMTDNGPQQSRYLAELRGKKGSVYNGGVKVPFYFRYPAQYQGNKDLSIQAAHIDVLPTLADLCSAQLPTDRLIDGKSLKPLLDDQSIQWQDRSLFFYWTRKYPELYNNMALMKGDYKIVAHTDYDAPITNFELFNIANDINEVHNLVYTEKPKAEQLKLEMQEIFEELTSSDNLLDGPRIQIGSEHENPTELNRNDAGGERAVWRQEQAFGSWRVSIAPGTYNFTFRFIQPVNSNGIMNLEINSQIYRKTNSNEETDEITLQNISLSKMDTDIIPFYRDPKRGMILPFTVEIEKVNPE